MQCCLRRQQDDFSVPQISYPAPNFPCARSPSPGDFIELLQGLRPVRGGIVAHQNTACEHERIAARTVGRPAVYGIGGRTRQRGTPQSRRFTACTSKCAAATQQQQFVPGRWSSLHIAATCPRRVVPAASCAPGCQAFALHLCRSISVARLCHAGPRVEVPSAAAPAARRRSVVVEANIFGRVSRVFRSYIDAAGDSTCV